MGRVQVGRCVREVHARHQAEHAAAGERRQVRIRLSHDREDERLRLYGLRDGAEHGTAQQRPPTAHRRHHAVREDTAVEMLNMRDRATGRFIAHADLSGFLRPKAV